MDLLLRCPISNLLLWFPYLLLRYLASGWWTGLLWIAIVKVEQSIVVKGQEWQQKARLLYEVWVALKLYPETPGGDD